MIQNSLRLFGKLVLLLSLSLFLFSCQTTRSLFSDEVMVDDLSLLDTKKQNEVINLAISKLEQGKKSDAIKLIDKVLRANPKQATAQLLKKQLTLSAKKIFASERITLYKVKSNQTLGSIAEKWLGDSLYFVSLAELNKIDNPSRITPGQILKIPVINTSPLVKKERRRSRANLSFLKKYNHNKHYLKSLARMTNIFILPSHYDELLKLQKNTLNLLAVSRVSISDRLDMVDQVRAISGQSRRNILEKQFQKFINLQLHMVLMDEFVLLFEDKSYRQSAKKLISAKKLGHYTTQNNKFQNTEAKLIDKLHEKAIILRKNRKLEQAASIWKLILSIQPTNELAKKYYNRTNKLLARLNSLN